MRAVNSVNRVVIFCRIRMVKKEAFVQLGCFACVGYYGIRLFCGSGVYSVPFVYSFLSITTSSSGHKTAVGEVCLAV